VAEIDCRPQLAACAVRVAQLAAGGAPLVGVANLYVSDALVLLTYTPVYTTGDEVEDKNACGTVKVNYKHPDSFKRGDVTIELVTPDPYLEAWLGGGDVLAAAVPTAAGASAPPIGPVTGNGVSIELWTKRIDDGDVDATYPYAHWAYPKIKNLKPGPHTHNNGPLHKTFTGEAYENTAWGDGPNNDFDADSDRVHQWIPVAALPAVSCTPGAVLADA
jgi:hypothetical protein